MDGKRGHVNVTACAVAALVVLASRAGAQCPKSIRSETEYEKVTLTETSEAAPGIAAFEGSFYLAWTGTDGPLNVVRSSDGLHFQDKITLSERSRHMASPSLTVFEGKLYLAWNGADQRLNVISSSDGRSFGNKVILGETSYVGPVVAAYGGKLYLAWTGTNRFVNVISSSDGINFRDKVTLSETATDSPALAAFQGKLYMAWAQSLGGDLNVMTSVDGVNFGSKLTLPERSYWFIWNFITGEVRHTGSALATYNGKLYLAWAVRISVSISFRQLTGRNSRASRRPRWKRAVKDPRSVPNLTGTFI